MLSSHLTELERAVARFVEREGLLAHGVRVTVAVSGGGDSVALLHVLLALAGAGADYQLSVAHLNHQLRPGDAERDETHVRELAGQSHLPYFGEARDVRAIARERRLNLEAAARAVRYEFLEQAARKLGSDHVATGHTRDDQLETILWRLRRSSRSAGPHDLHSLAGILPCRPIREGSSITLIRPVLEVSRRQLREYLTARSTHWLTDHTNRDLGRTRNLIRHRLLPLLREQLGQDCLSDLLRLSRRVAQLNRQGQELTDQLLSAGARRPAAPGKGLKPLVFSVDWLRALPEEFRSALLYRALRQMELELAPPGRFLDTALTGRHVQAVLKAVDADRSLLIDQLPGDLVAWRREEELLIGPRAAEAPSATVPARPLPEGDGSVAVSELGLRVVVRTVQRSELDWPAWLRDKERDEDMLDADAAGPRTELVLRTRRPGDRFRPLGALGGKKLKDFFIDRKVPRRERDGTLLLARRAQVLWLAGLGVSERVKVQPVTRQLLHLRIELLSEETA